MKRALLVSVSFVLALVAACNSVTVVPIEDEDDARAPTDAGDAADAGDAGDASE